MIRLQLGMTLEVFGSQFSPEANKSNVSRWEKDRAVPSPDRLKRISELGNVSVDYLLYGVSYNIDEIKYNVFNKLLNEFDPSSFEGKALNYFDNDQLDEVLMQVMESYFKIPFVLNNEHLYTLKSTAYLEGVMLFELTERYRINVISNQNLIIDHAQNIMNKKNNLTTYNQIKSLNYRFTDLLDSLSIKDDNDIFDTDNPTLDVDNSKIDIKLVDKSIDENLKNDLKEILDDTYNRINELHEKYPDNPSDIEIDIELSGISKLDYTKYLYWNLEGNKEIQDEIHLKESIKDKIIDTVTKEINK